MPITYDKGMVGQSADLGTIDITLDMIQKYALAVGATLPDDPSQIVAPPLFCNVLMSGGGAPVVKTEGGRRQFMAGQGYEPNAPVRPGDRLQCTATIADIYEKTGRSGGMLFIVRETAFTNQNNELVAKIRQSAVIQE